MLSDVGNINPLARKNEICCSGENINYQRHLEDVKYMMFKAREHAVNFKCEMMPSCNNFKLSKA